MRSAHNDEAPAASPTFGEASIKQGVVRRTFMGRAGFA